MMKRHHTFSPRFLGEVSRVHRAMIIVVSTALTLTALTARAQHRVKADTRSEAGATVQCQYVVRPLTRSFAEGGGLGSLTILATDNCSWSATSNAPWIELVAFNSGSVLGPGRVNYSVLANAAQSQRTGTVTVAGQTFTITQAGSSSTTCTVAPISTGQNVMGSLAPGDCPSPLRIKDGSHPLADRYSFSGTAGHPVIITVTSADIDTYLYLLDANGSIIAQNDDTGEGASSRVPANNGFVILPTTGTFTIEVTSFSSGSSGNYALSLAIPSGNCTYAINAVGQAFSTAGGAGIVTVTTQASCAWGAMSNNGWLGIGAAGSSGSGIVNYIVAANPGVALTGTLTVAGLTFTVRQAGTNGSGCPTVGLVSPNNSSPGGVITITGTNFTGVTAVKFANSVAAQFAIVGDTQMTTTVPGGAVTGPLAITKPTCADAQTNNFSANLVVTTVSAASYAGAPLAPEAIVAAFGAGLATGVSVAASVPLPTVLLGTSVRVKDSAGVERLASLFFVSGGQINLQIPPGTANGSATVMVLGGGGAISVGTIQVARTAPGIFAANAGGTGLAAAQIFRLKGDGSQATEPIAQYDQGQAIFIPIPIDLGPASDQVFLVLYGTGIRNRTDLSTVTATIGGAAASVVYAGPAPGFVGLDQVNLPLSRSLIGRGEVTVTLVVEGRSANPVTVTIK